MCRQGGRLAEGEQAARRAVAMAPNFARRLEQSRHHPAGDAEARRKPALPRAGARARSQQRRDAQQSRQHHEAAWPRGGGGEALDRRAQASSPITPRPTATFPTCSTIRANTTAPSAMARRAIELSPRLADAYINLAGGRDSAPPPRRRARHARRAARLRADPPARARGARADAEGARPARRGDGGGQARASRRRRTAPKPHNAEGQVYQAMGRFELALAAYDRAAALPGPAQQDAITNRGALFMEFGRQAEARAGLRGGGEDLSPVVPGSCSARRTSSASSRAIR